VSVKIFGELNVIFSKYSRYWD